ncbi:hypothetical protein N657DRAFT_652691 [Parathielavia appendiculata]|uniref:Uncharacterized protein n=1 Tax=Parathielavia appendiculata TaxID=2587402 RepID=A0AAN6UAU6_9PEZI|nr:hypothetical protein N657DRAFT_652691 [Parathielavia appendiculata]
MAFFTEFYLTTVWNFKPNVVRRVIDDFAGMGLAQAEFTYDSEYGWFKVTCLEEHASEIRNKFVILACAIEGNAFDTYEDGMLETNDTLRVHLLHRATVDHEWFTQLSDTATTRGIDEPSASSCLSQPLTESSRTALWDDLDKNNEPYTVHQIMTVSERDQIQEDLRVELSSRLAGKLVYITGQSEEFIRKARDRLRVMLAIELEESYKIIYQQAASIRICPWSPQRGSVRDRDRTMLGNRPTIFTRTLDLLTFSADEFILPEQRGMVKATSKVETWIENVEAQADAATDTAQSILNVQGASQPSPALADEDLINFEEKPATSHRGPAIGASTGKPDTTLLDDNNPIPSLSQDFSALRGEPGTLGASTTSNHLLTEPETGHDCLVDMLAAVATPVFEGASTSKVCWQIRPLVPPPSEFEEDGSSTANWEEYLSVLEKSPRRSGKAATHSQTDQRRPQQKMTADINGIDAQPTPTPDQDPDTRIPISLLTTEAFIKRIESATARVLSMSPYRRGRLVARAEFGRIILEHGLVRRLTRDFGKNQDIHFTNILSTYACDVKDMINMTANGARLWKENPTRAWTTYSFHCSLNATHKPRRFVVDIEDDGASSGFSFLIRLPSDVSDKGEQMPVYIHAIRRHWDLRITVPHARQEGVSGAYLSLATTLLQSLSVSFTEKGLPLLCFAVRKDFHVAVNEVRVLTKWRHASLSGKSAFEITEVQQMEMVPCSEGVYSGYGDSWEGKLARPWPSRRIRDNRAKGEIPRWYEAAVVSLELEKCRRQNIALRVGEKANWAVQDLKARGVFSTLYEPALHMVAQMDHVGKLDDNNLSQAYGHLLQRPNNPGHHMPGCCGPVGVDVGNGEIILQGDGHGVDMVYKAMRCRMSRMGTKKLMCGMSWRNVPADNFDLLSGLWSAARRFMSDDGCGHSHVDG